MRPFAQLFLMVAFGLLVTMAVFGKPPPNTDVYGTTHLWFDSLHNKNGTSCCTEADCHILTRDEWRRDAIGYEVKIHDQWQRVPPDKLTQSSIFSTPVACWSSADFLYCFAPPIET